MAAAHPDLEAEQAYIDHAYECLDATREAASRMRGLVEVGRGGTEQARFERDVIWETMLHRLSQLQLGQQSLCFGRIDRVVVADDEGGEVPRVEAGGHGTVGGNGSNGSNGRGGEAGPDGAHIDSFYIGRVAVSDRDQEPVIVDWRAPVAEPFYRATGRQPLGLARRRHFASRGRTLLNIEDELFGEAAAQLGGGAEADGSISGHGALIAALQEARTGRLTDIVATIQGEQDEVIRAPMPGVLVVQGGPGTGKTVVALHRAAYLLYTHRFPLEGQGVLVVGPNRLFLSYIEQVLPSLGEAGVELAVLADLIDEDDVRGRDDELAGRVKGDPRMVELLRRAIAQRERPLRDDLVVGYGLQHLRLRREEGRRIVREARRRFRRHNAGRRYVEQEVYAALARSGRGELVPAEVRERLRRTDMLREALERMWPVLSPAELLHDLYGAPSLLRAAGEGLFEPAEVASLHRDRAASLDDVTWTEDDVPLLDEAATLLGPDPRRRRTGPPPDEGPRTYGHIVVDEAQDLSPMQLRMLDRRSLGGSMTIVGDIAQATGAWAHDSWDDVLAHLPAKHAPRRVELTLGYRLPAPNMALAGRVLREAAPELSPPRSVREDGDVPRIVRAPSTPALPAAVAAEVQVQLDALGVGNLAVICPSDLVEVLGDALADAGIEHGQATRHGLETPVTVVPVRLVKGLELDASVVVEPAGIVDEELAGLRGLYVALTRATRRLAVVHARDLPDALRE